LSKVQQVTKRYFVHKKYEDVPSSPELTRGEVVKLLEQRVQGFSNSIQERFPQVEFLTPTLFGPFVQLTASEKKMKKLIKSIESAFDCRLVDADTPVELIW